MKESYYFSHDYDAQNDPKLQALISEFKGEGYGIYWAIVELLHKETSHYLPLKKYIYLAIAKQMLTSAELVENLIRYAIDECELFIEDDNQFTSNRVLRNFEKREEISQKRSEAGKLGAIAKQNAASAKQNSTKERKGKEIKRNNTIPEDEQSSEVNLSKLLFDLMLKNNPNAKQPNFQNWAKHIDLMKRIDKRTDKEIEDVIYFSQSDDFWQSNILSTEKLRKHFDRLYLKSKGKSNHKVCTYEEMLEITKLMSKDQRKAFFDLYKFEDGKYHKRELK